MSSNEFDPDPQLSPEQAAAVEQLSLEQLARIDSGFLENSDSRWRKVARVVGTTMMSDSPSRIEGIPDIFYSQRIQTLVKNGQLEANGNLKFMAFSEVRLPRPTGRGSET